MSPRPHGGEVFSSERLGQAKFSHDKLLTALVEVEMVLNSIQEMVLNSRPLTYISADD